MECKMMKPWSTDSSEWQPSQIKTEPSEHSETPELKPFDPSLITGMSMLPFGFDPLTPPGYIGMYPPVQQQQQQQNQQLHHHQGPPVVQQRSETPRTSRIAPANASLSCSSSPGMDVTPPKSPKDTPETSEHGSEAETYETEIREPRMNSHGKYKRYKCKSCNFIAITKASFWDHQRTNHLKPEKMLHCPQCPFVTEFKHHLEYHNLNHSNSKPFQCPECPYRCVNNSMLSSHMKSHSDVLAYRCADCSYATKYCHSLKQHLRKYSHNPGPVLNEDGTPNPLPVIDVYGTRRGPRSKGGKVKRVNNAKNKTQCPSSPPPPPPPPPAIPADLPNDRISPGLPIPPMALAEMYLGFLARQNFIQNTAAVEEALNLVQKEQPKGRSRRKGPAFKFDATLDGDNDEKPAKTTSPISDTPTQLPPHLNSPRGPLECHFCEIIFKNPDLHTIHMCYHNVHDAFRCNKCGTKCQDSISFFLHLARDPHM